MFELILGIVSVALQLWLYKEKNKYVDKKIALETAYYKEMNLPLEERDFAVLDNLEAELKIFARALTEEIKRNPN